MGDLRGFGVWCECGHGLDFLSVTMVNEPRGFPRHIRYPAGEICSGCGRSWLDDRAKRFFVDLWLNLCRAIAPVGARIALDERLAPRTEEELAAVALAHWLDSGADGHYGFNRHMIAIDPGFLPQRAWSPWLCADHPASALRCRFCDNVYMHTASVITLRHETEDEAVLAGVRMHALQCALRYWANEVVKP